MERGKAFQFFLVCFFALGGLFFGVSLRFSHELHITKNQTAKIVLQDSVAGTLATEEMEPITLLFVGDIMLSRGVAYQAEKNGGDGRYPFLRIGEELQKADITFGNLEGPLSDTGENQHHLYSFRADPKMMDGLIYSGFDVLSLANNHMGDWGSDALADTVKRISDAGIVPVGAGENYVAANELKTKKIGNTAFGLLAYTNLLPERFIATGDEPGGSTFDIEKIKESIRSAHEKAEVVIVSVHWGEEYETEPRGYQKDWGHAFIDAGADIIVGHRPHVVQPMERYKDGVIMYSLGNFVFDQNFPEETMEGRMVEVRIKENAVLEVEELRIKISPTFQPYVEENN